ncbi:hypothetical protein MKX01_018123 [Papaver californicum]|nr:hypothetical protein MKX01_018123 [Papaver californicum]
MAVNVQQVQAPTSSTSNHQQVQVPTSSTSNHTEASFPRMKELFNETFGRIDPNDLDEIFGEPDQQNDSGQQNRPNDSIYNNIIKDVVQSLYPNCEGDHTKLSATIELLSMKARHQGIEALFTETLQFMKKIFPKGNTLPEIFEKLKLRLHHSS